MLKTAAVYIFLAAFGCVLGAAFVTEKDQTQAANLRQQASDAQNQFMKSQQALAQAKAALDSDNSAINKLVAMHQSDADLLRISADQFQREQSQCAVQLQQAYAAVQQRQQVGQISPQTAAIMIDVLKAILR